VQTGTSAGYVISELIKDLLACRDIDINKISSTSILDESRRKKTFQVKFPNGTTSQVLIKRKIFL
jgi:hypothetical protein